MQIFYDLVPVLLFFIAYKWLGIYPATAIAMAASLLQISYHWFKHKKLEMMQTLTAVIILVFGGLTLLFHNPIFIKWKPSIINGLFALIFFVMPYIKKKSLIELLLGDKVNMAPTRWTTLNRLWISFFLVTAVINLYVIYHYTTDQWVNFKVLGLLTLTIIFGVIQAIYLSKHASFKTRS